MNHSVSGQGPNDWLRDVRTISIEKPLDFGGFVELAKNDSTKIYIGIFNIDIKNDIASRVDLSKTKDLFDCISNYDVNRVFLKAYNYKGDSASDLFIKWDISKQPIRMKGDRRSSFYIITSSRHLSNRLKNNQELRRSLSIFYDSDIKVDGVSVFSSLGVDDTSSGNFCWKLKQNITYFSAIQLPISSKTPLNNEKCRINFELNTNVGLIQQVSKYRMLRATGGVAFILNKYNLNIDLNLGLQQSSDIWRNESIQPRVNNFPGSSIPLDELLVKSSNVKENYNLSATSGVFGLDVKYYLGKSNAYIGIYVNLVKPIVYDLNFTNMSGEFDYVGISNSIQEPFTNIPELGLFSGVSYVGYKSDLTGKLKTFYDFGLMSGYSFGEKSSLDINLSVGFTTSKKFDLERSNSAISSSYGEYNSLSTVSTTQIAVPCFWNVGLGVRKYLN